QTSVSASRGRQGSLPDVTEDFIKLVDIDVEDYGEAPDTSFNDLIQSGRHHSQNRSIISRDLCDISDDEMDQLPRARPNPELDALVDCSSFRNGTRAASIPPESPTPERSHIYEGDLSPISVKSSEPTGSDKYNGMVRRHSRMGLGRDREISRSPPAPPSTPPRDDRRARLENLKKLNFPARYKMKERVDDVSSRTLASITSWSHDSSI
ncbi:hypothetical protein KIN20_017960, partial [Parelaphostrongylus tenuis]